ncbi:ogr/Delta-like zinc finger family protein [Serratia aquatilis]
MCNSLIKTRSSRTLSEYVKEKYYYCSNPACLCVFKTYECFEHFITTTIDPTITANADIQVSVPQPPTQPKRRYSMRLE